MKVGVQTSIAGGLEKAVQRAHQIGCDTFQIFSANPRGWRALEPSPEDCGRFREAVIRHRQSPVAVHDNYLINLASADAKLRALSIAAFRRELIRAVALGADYLVTHPGSAKGTTRARALGDFVSSLRKAARGLKLDGLTVLIENTAGQGDTLGCTFEEVAEIIARAGTELPLGVCIDTAHCFAAGYPVHTQTGLEQTLGQLDSTIGLRNVRLVHANDSKAPFGSRVDRHQHIGKGAIGMEAFGRIVRHPNLERVPFICETPIDRPGDDKRNLRVMRRLAGAESNGHRR